MFEEEVEPYGPSQSLPPVGTVQFIPSPLTKGIIGLAASLVCGIYGVVQLGRYQNDLLLDSMEERSSTKETT